MSTHRASHTGRHLAGHISAAVSMTAAVLFSVWVNLKRQPARVRRVSIALLATVALMLGMLALAPAAGFTPAADGTDTLAFLRGQRDACQVMLDSATTSAQRTRARACISDVERAIAALLATPQPSSSATPSPTSSPTGTPTASPTAPSPSPTTTSAPSSPTASPAPSPTQTPTPSPSPTTGWPGPDNTGVPAGTTLSVYTGPCRITVPTTIDAKLVSCDLDIATTGVVITRSSIGGTVSVDSPTSETAPRLSISDSVIDAGHRQATGLGDGLFVATRVEVRGGNRGVLCAWRCELRDSWVHGTYVQDDWHASGVRAERFSTIVHNTLACDWLVPVQPGDAGCSANLTGYGDFAAPHDWLIQGNLFVANPCASCPVSTAGHLNGAAFCAYGGSSPGKPFSSDPLTGTNIVFRDNTFQRGATRHCAAFDAVDSFNAAKPGAVWQNNRYDDNTLVVP